MNWDTILVLGFLAIVAIYLFRSRKTEDELLGIVKEAMPLWASFAPFKNGSDSANTLYYCQWATGGKKLVDGLLQQNAYEGHAKSYDQNPKEWEKVIKKSLEAKTKDLDKKVRLVTALFELDSMKKEGNLPNWDSYTGLGYIIRSPNDNSASKLMSMLEGLMEKNTDIASKTQNLMEDYVVYTGKELDENLSAGFLCFVCLSYAKENPELEISKELIDLKNKAVESFEHVK